MFSKSNKSPVTALRHSEAPAKMDMNAKHSSFSMLGSDMLITGDVGASEDLHIDGKIEGNVTSTVMIQGEKSEIKGMVKADTVKLAGLLDGSVEAAHVTVHASARITGDVTYEAIIIEQGAKVDGRLSLRRTPETAKTKVIKNVIQKPPFSEKKSSS